RMRSYDNARGSSNATPKRQQRAPKRSSRRTSSSKQRSEGEASGLHNRFERGLAQIWDDFNRYQPYYSILVEFLNSQVSLRVDEGTSTRSAIAVAERVQLHRILLCDEDRPSGPHDDESMRSSPPTDESVVKARSMVELENVQVFTVNRGDFENRAAYFADCTYGSPLNDSATQPAALWPAWVPIELLLDQGTDKTRGIFDESDKSAESGSADQSGPPGAEAEGRRESAGYGNAWWLEDLSKYKRLMNRDSGLLVYDRANPLCIRGDTKDNAVRDTSSHAQAASAGDPAASPSALGAGMRSAEASVHSGEQDGDSLSGESESGDDPAADAAAADDVDAPDSGQGVSHHANHISVFLPEVNLACTAEQYTTAYEIVTELLVFIDPEKAMYMDHLNTIQLGMDMDDLRGLLSIIRATQSALRERIPMIHDWYALHRGRAAFSSRPGVGGDGGLSRESAWSRSPAASLLTLGRHRQALELQLRTALDLIGVAQKQIRQQQQQQKSHGLWPGNARGKEETNNAIARTIRLFINRASWHMLENDEQPLCDVVLRWASLRAVTMADQATHLVSEVHLLYVINRLPNPMFTDLVGPYIRPKEPAPDFCVQKMLRFRWSELAPVGGITIVERFEVDLFPLRLQLSYDIAQKLINYLYPPQDSGGADASLGQGTVPSRRQRRSTMASIASDETEASAGDTPSATSPTPGASSDGLPRAEPGDSPSTHASGTASPRTATSARFGTLGSSGRSLFAAKMKRAADGQTAGQRASSEEPPTAAPGDTAHLQRTASGLLSTIAGYAGPIPLLTENGSMANIPQGSDNRGQVDEMKKRASSNKTFLNVKIGGSTLCISYQGRRTNNITDLRDFEFRAPTLVLRNEVESYFELLMQVKREYRSVVVQHTGALVKEKFRQLHNRKAWSKTSSGPDWAARRLLIDMDRRIDQEMLASMRGAVHDVTAAAPALGPGCAFEHAPGSAPPASQEAVAAGEPSPALSTASVSDDPLARSAPSPGPSAARGIAAPGDPAKGKAPLSKYMILDPRKLMGKRLPSVLPRNIAPAGPGHSGSPSPHLPAEDGGAHRVSALASESGPRAVYSAMHADMAPAMLQQTRPATADSSSSSSSRLTGAARQPARQAPLFQRRFTASLSPASPGASPRFGPAEKTGSAPDADVVHPSQ
ncbi:Protein SABRE, partial [Coemansia biformis]